MQRALAIVRAVGQVSAFTMYYIVYHSTINNIISYCIVIYHSIVISISISTSISNALNTMCCMTVWPHDCMTVWLFTIDYMICIYTYIYTYIHIYIYICTVCYIRGKYIPYTTNHILHYILGHQITRPPDHYIIYTRSLDHQIARSLDH